jgi:hypothetical protein
MAEAGIEGKTGKDEEVEPVDGSLSGEDSSPASQVAVELCTSALLMQRHALGARFGINLEQTDGGTSPVASGSENPRLTAFTPPYQM